MSLGMFSKIPLPFHIWDEMLMPLMVAGLPVVGLVVGVLWWLFGLLLFALGLPSMLMAALLALAPFFFAGFLHLDGYMDTSDALLSYRPLEDRLRILKDPNVGSFAVVMLGILFVLQFAAFHAVVENGGAYLALVIAISVVSRSCSAFSIFTLTHMPQSNYTFMLSQNIGLGHKVFVALALVAAALFSFLYAGFLGPVVLLVVVLAYAVALMRVYKSFEGISGDLLGYSIVIGELFGLIALAILINLGCFI